MALERVPADIRKNGGVARMSDPTIINEIKSTVTIPVMAKARIGHYVEAQILEALNIDYIDESEVTFLWLASQPAYPPLAYHAKASLHFNPAVYLMILSLGTSSVPFAYKLHAMPSYFEYTKSFLNRSSD